MDPFDYSLVITCSENRLNIFKEMFKWHNLPMPTVLEGVRDKLNPVSGCSRSHMLAISYAKAHDWPYAMVLEDDAFPRYDCLEQLPKYFKELPENWQLVKLEDLKFEICRSHKKVVQGNNHFFIPGLDIYGSGSAAYLIKNDFYLTALKLFNFAKDVRYEKRQEYLIADRLFPVAAQRQVIKGLYMPYLPMFAQATLDKSEAIHPNKQDLKGQAEFTRDFKLEEFKAYLKSKSHT